MPSMAPVPVGLAAHSPSHTSHFLTHVLTRRDPASTLYPNESNIKPAPITLGFIVGLIIAVVGSITLVIAAILVIRRRQLRLARFDLPLTASAPVGHRKSTSTSTLGSSSALSNKINLTPLTKPSNGVFTLRLHRSDLSSSSLTSFPPPTKSKFSSFTLKDEISEHDYHDNREETLDISSTGWYHERPTGIKLSDIQISDAQVDPERERRRTEGNTVSDMQDLSPWSDQMPTAPSKVLLKQFR